MLGQGLKVCVETAMISMWDMPRGKDIVAIGVAQGRYICRHSAGTFQQFLRRKSGNYLQPRDFDVISVFHNPHCILGRAELSARRGRAPWSARITGELPMAAPP